MGLRLFTVSDTTPAAASTAIGATQASLGNWDFLRVDAMLVGATGGTLDVYLQRCVGPDAWADWVHFTQLASGAAAVRYSLMASLANSTTITTANAGTDTVPAVGLGAGTFIGGHPGDTIRAVYVAGAGTSAGAAIKFYIRAWGSAWR
jgi:hypothetical protein